MRKILLILAILAVIVIAGVAILPNPNPAQDNLELNTDSTTVVKDTATVDTPSTKVDSNLNSNE